MKYPYSGKFSPPALMVPAELSIPHQGEGAFRCRAKLDTAADISVVPRKFIERFGPLAFNTLRIRQTDRCEYSYLLEITIAGHRYSVEAVAHDASYALIGRDILNQCTLIADGPNETFELIQNGIRRKRCLAYKEES